MNTAVLSLCWFGEAAQAAPDGAQQTASAPADEPADAARKTQPEEAGKRTEDGEKPAVNEPQTPRGPEREERKTAPERGPEPADEAYFREALSKAALAARYKAAEATAARWEKEAEELKEIYPFFSLERSMRSDRGFVTLLKAGVPVRLAFEAANLEKILGAAMRYAAGAAGKRTVQSILAGTNRVRENPVLDRASSVRKKDVGSLTDREIMKILRQVSNGERVTF